MKFRTEIQVARGSCLIGHHSRVLLLGSCFATNVGQKLGEHRFATLTNPHGVLFNPASICQAVRHIARDADIDPRYLVTSDGLWHSLLHHGSFSVASREQCVEQINQATRQAHQFLQTATHAIVTLGTAQVWRHKGLGEVVSNCHKIPGTEFDHLMLPVAEVQQMLQATVDELRAERPGINIIFTLSPVRYLNKGMHANQLSKATLLLAIDQVQGSNALCHYFPAYEIVQDDLRDYRFYDSDLVHPSNDAVEYIWEMFGKMFFDDKTLAINERIAKLNSAAAHRPLHTDSQSYAAFQLWLEKEEEKMRREMRYEI